MVYPAHGKINQQWDIMYVDEWKGEPQKGELNEKFGLYVERDFHIVSQLPENRYLDLINNRNMVIKTSNGRRSQVWYFHQQTLTIRTRYNNQSFDIKNSGKTKDMQIWSTNSRWGRSLFIAENTSVIFKNLTDVLMSTTVKMLKDKRFKFMEDTMEPTKDGRSCILTKRQRPRPRD